MSAMIHTAHSLTGVCVSCRSGRRGQTRRSSFPDVMSRNVVCMPVLRWLIVCVCVCLLTDFLCVHALFLSNYLFNCILFCLPLLSTFMLSINLSESNSVGYCDGLWICSSVVCRNKQQYGHTQTGFHVDISRDSLFFRIKWEVSDRRICVRV